MSYQRTINGFAEDHDTDVAAVILSVLKYICDDPNDITLGVRNALLNASDEDIEDALETIEDDLRAGAKRVI